MFERFTEKARRVIFFARYETSQFGSPYIETEHLLLGLLREDKALTQRFLGSSASVDSIRKQIEARATMREKIPRSVDLPLSQECKRVLAYGAEEAERLQQKYIETMHLLLGLLREERGFAAELLRERGLSLELVRQEAASIKPFGDEVSSTSAPAASSGTAVFDPVGVRFDPAGVRDLQTAIAAYISARGQEWKVSAVLDYPILARPGNVVIADVAVLLAEAPVAVLPVPLFVCVEILTNDSRLRETLEHIDDYLGAGVRYVWLLDPATKRAYTATSETGLREVRDSVLKTENPVLELPLAEVFS